MDDELVAFACGTCEDVRSAHWRPDFCGRCRARFDLGAPIALVTLQLGVTTGSGALQLRPAYRVEAVGSWATEARERVEALFGQHAAPNATRATTPSRPRTRDSRAE